MGKSKVYNVNSKDGESSLSKHQNTHGLHWIVGAVFLVGSMAGGGLVALPYSMMHTGLWIGIVYLLLGAIISGYTGIQLGHNWTLMQNRWSEYKEHCRNPYPEMAYRALGPNAKRFVEAALFATQFGTVVVLLLLASKNISNFLATFFDLSIDFCTLIVIVAIALWPLIMLKSPKDFWYVAVGAAISTTIAVILMLIGASRDAPTCLPQANYPSVRTEGLFLAYGTVIFAYGGHSSFPTIQHDMKKPYHFNRSVIASYICLLIIYIPVTVLGYLVYGSSLQDSIIPSVQTVWIQQTINILITVHVTLTVIIDFSPLSQGIEEMVNTPHDFGWKRVAVRTALLVSVVFVAESIPHFGVILDLIGGTLETLMTMMLPSIFYLFLFAAKKKEEMEKKDGKGKKGEEMTFAAMKDVLKYTPWTVLLFNLCCLAFGLIGGVVSTYTSVRNLVEFEMATPCYMRYFMDAGPTVTHAVIGSVNCCGLDRNITTPFFEGTCNAFKL